MATTWSSVSTGKIMHDCWYATITTSPLFWHGTGALSSLLQNLPARRWSKWELNQPVRKVRWHIYIYIYACKPWKVMRETVSNTHVVFLAKHQCVHESGGAWFNSPPTFRNGWNLKIRSLWIILRNSLGLSEQVKTAFWYFPLSQLTKLKDSEVVVLFGQMECWSLNHNWFIDRYESTCFSASTAWYHIFWYFQCSWLTFGTWQLHPMGDPVSNWPRPWKLILKQNLNGDQVHSKRCKKK